MHKKRVRKWDRQGKTASMVVSKWGLWPGEVSRGHRLEYGFVVLAEEWRSSATYLPACQPPAKVTLRGVNSPACLPILTGGVREKKALGMRKTGSCSRKPFPGVWGTWYQGRKSVS